MCTACSAATAFGTCSGRCDERWFSRVLHDFGLVIISALYCRMPPNGVAVEAEQWRSTWPNRHDGLKTQMQKVITARATCRLAAGTQAGKKCRKLLPGLSRVGVLMQSHLIRRVMALRRHLVQLVAASHGVCRCRRGQPQQMHPHGALMSTGIVPK